MHHELSRRCVRGKSMSDGKSKDRSMPDCGDANCRGHCSCGHVLDHSADAECRHCRRLRLAGSPPRPSKPDPELAELLLYPDRPDGKR